MTDAITVRECSAPQDLALFRQRLQEYFVRDIHPGDNGFAGFTAQYREAVEAMRSRSADPVEYLMFERGGEDVGIALTVVYASEDGRQFILEFCVFPESAAAGRGAAMYRSLGFETALGTMLACDL